MPYRNYQKIQFQSESAGIKGKERIQSLISEREVHNNQEYDELLVLKRDGEWENKAVLFSFSPSKVANSKWQARSCVYFWSLWFYWPLWSSRTSWTWPSHFQYQNWIQRDIGAPAVQQTTKKTLPSNHSKLRILLRYVETNIWRFQ